MKKLILCEQEKIDAALLLEKVTQHFSVNQSKQISEQAIELIFLDKVELTDELRRFFYENKINFSLQDNREIKRKLFISDMDATMVLGETIDEMASAFCLSDDFMKITEKAMQGEIAFDEALNQRLALLKGMQKDKIVELAEKVTLNLGAKELLTELKQRGVYTCLVSGGFTLFSEVVAEKLGFDEHHANQLGFSDNRLTGHYLGSLVDGQRKKEILVDWTEKNQVDCSEVIAIGDGANDIPMLKAAGLGVAYYAKPATRQAVNTEIHSGSLEQLKYFL